MTFTRGQILETAHRYQTLTDDLRLLEDELKYRDPFLQAMSLLASVGVIDRAKARKCEDDVSVGRGSVGSSPRRRIPFSSTLPSVLQEGDKVSVAGDFGAKRTIPLRSVQPSVLPRIQCALDVLFSEDESSMRRLLVDPSSPFYFMSSSTFDYCNDKSGKGDVSHSAQRLLLPNAERGLLLLRLQLIVDEFQRATDALNALLSGSEEKEAVSESIVTGVEHTNTNGNESTGFDSPLSLSAGYSASSRLSNQLQESIIAGRQRNRALTEQANELIVRLRAQEDALESVRTASAMSSNGGLPGNQFSISAAPLRAATLELARRTFEFEKHISQIKVAHTREILSLRSAARATLLARDKEFIQLQLLMRNALRALPGKQRTVISKLAEEEEVAKSSSLEAEQLAMQHAEAFFEEKMAERVAQITATYEMQIDILQAQISAVNGGMQEIEQDARAGRSANMLLIHRVKYIERALDHILLIEVPHTVSRITEASKEARQLFQRKLAFLTREQEELRRQFAVREQSLKSELESQKSENMIVQAALHAAEELAKKCRESFRGRQENQEEDKHSFTRQSSGLNISGMNNPSERSSYDDGAIEPRTPLAHDVAGQHSEIQNVRIQTTNSNDFLEETFSRADAVQQSKEPPFDRAQEIVVRESILEDSEASEIQDKRSQEKKKEILSKQQKCKDSVPSEERPESSLKKKKRRSTVKSVSYGTIRQKSVVGLSPRSRTSMTPTSSSLIKGSMAVVEERVQKELDESKKTIQDLQNHNERCISEIEKLKQKLKTAKQTKEVKNLEKRELSLPSKKIVVHDELENIDVGTSVSKVNSIELTSHVLNTVDEEIGETTVYTKSDEERHTGYKGILTVVPAIQLVDQVPVSLSIDVTRVSLACETVNASTQTDLTFSSTELKENVLCEMMQSVTNPGYFPEGSSVTELYSVVSSALKDITTPTSELFSRERSPPKIRGHHTPSTGSNITSRDAQSPHHKSKADDSEKGTSRRKGRLASSKERYVESKRHKRFSVESVSDDKKQLSLMHSHTDNQRAEILKPLFLEDACHQFPEREDYVGLIVALATNARLRCQLQDLHTRLRFASGELTVHYGSACRDKKTGNLYSDYCDDYKNSIGCETPPAAGVLVTAAAAATGTTAVSFTDVLVELQPVPFLCDYSGNDVIPQNRLFFEEITHRVKLLFELSQHQRLPLFESRARAGIYVPQRLALGPWGDLAKAWRRRPHSALVAPFTYPPLPHGLYCGRRSLLRGVRPLCALGGGFLYPPSIRAQCDFVDAGPNHSLPIVPRKGGAVGEATVSIAYLRVGVPDEFSAENEDSELQECCPKYVEIKQQKCHKSKDATPRRSIWSQNHQRLRRRWESLARPLSAASAHPEGIGELLIVSVGGQRV